MSTASAEPVVGESVYVANKMQGYGGTALVGIFANTPPDIGNLGTPEYWSYCVEHDIPVGTFRIATLEAPPSYLGSNYFTSATIQAKVLWVLAHSYPHLSLSDFGTAAGVPGISASDAIEAAQYAIWRYTDLDFDAAWNWETPDSETAYWYLVNGANASSGMTLAELQSTAAIVAPGGTQVAGTLVGPFTVSTNQPIASVSVTGGYTLTDASGTAIDTSAVTDGDEIYIDLTGVTAAGSATVTVSAAGSSVSGNIVSVPETAGGVATADSHAQTLMIVAPSTFRTTDSAAVSWVSGTPPPAFCPAAGDPTQVFSLVNGVDIYGYTPPGTSDALLPLLPATVSGNLNALMLDPLRNRLLMIQRSSGTASTLWAYDSANGGWYVAFGPFVSPDFPRGGFNASGTGYLLGGGSNPEVWEVESSSAFGYTVTSIGVMNYDHAPTDFSSGDIAFDGSDRAWLAVGQDLYHLDLSGSSPFPAVRQTRPLLGGSPSTIGWAGIAFAEDGTLILANNAPSPSAYYQYDPATGVIVHLSNTTANASRDLASCAFPARSDPALSVAKTLTAVNGAPYVPPTAVSAGDTLTYTLTVTNSGGAVATLFAGDVVETVPAETTHVSGDSFTCAAATAGSSCGNTSTFNVAAGASADLSFTVQVGATPTGASITNTVAIPGEVDCAIAPNDCEEATPVLTPANVTLAKTLSGESGSLSGQAEAGEQLTYTITLTNSGGTPALNYGVTDTLDPNVTFVSADNGGAAAGGAVTWSGLTVPANGTLTLTVVVQVVDPIPAGVTQIGNVAYETGTTPPPCPPAGGQCVVVPTAPQVSIVKSAGMPAPTGVPNQYALTYVVTVHNAGGSVGAYDLADTLTFNGAAVTAVTTPVHASSSGEVQDGVPGVFTPPAGGSIVTGERIGAQGSETWTYTVTYTVDDADLAADCISPSGGLRNHALLGGASAGPPAADTCTGAPSVSIVKTAAAPVPTGMPNQFALTYTAEVANTGTLPGAYDLTDALTFNGATVDAISAPAYTSSTDTQDGTLGAFTAPAGGTIVSGESISADGTETWTYTVTYTVTDAAAAQDCADPSRGLRNRAELGGSLGGQSTTCTGAPAVNIGKSASGPVPTGNPDEYRLTYRVNVQNDGSLPGTYDLADTFTFGGVTVVSVGAVQHGGSDPLATPLGTLTATGGTIVTGETIAAGASESYTYTVTFTIDDVNAVGTCATDGGLKNQAELGGSASGQVGTCSDVPDIAVTKTATGPAPAGAANQYAITYTVAISNTGAAAGSYDLSDAFTFAGATVDTVSAVTHAGPDPLATTLGTLTATGGTIVTGETIAAAGVETYTYTVTFTLTDPALADDCANPAGGLRNVAVLGGSASGDAATCTGTPRVTIAKALTGESGSAAGVAEPGEQLTYTITLTNTGTMPALDQHVADRLDPNVTFVSADNGGTQVGGNVEWNGLTVPAGGSLTLTVTVRVADPLPAGVIAIGNVAYDPAIGPPTDCNVTPLPPNCTTTPTPAVVAIVKALAGESGTLPGVAESGEQLTYTITLTNTGGSDATGYGVTDALDPNTVFVSADNGGVGAGGTVTWSGLTVPANGSLVLTVVVRVADPLPAGVTQVANVAYETGTPPPPCPPAGGQCVVVPTAGAVTIAKSVQDANGDGLAAPGEQLTYRIVLTNTGGSDATSYGVTDPLDANTVFVSADNGGTFAAGVVSWSGLTVPANGTLALTVVVRVVDPVPPGVTQIDNVAYETGTPPPDCEATPRPANCTSIEVPPPTGTPQLLITKTAGSATLRPGGTVVYTITVSNVGNADAIGAVVNDPIPAGIDTFAWTCAASGGVACPNASGSGAIAETVATFPVGATLVYTVTATVSANPPATVVNTATVTPGGLATCAPAGTQPPCPATVIGTVTPAQPPLPVPAVNKWAQLLIALSLFGLAWRSWRRVGE
ncbi:Cys-Gln thioester bond-forming surface protein [Dokdonella koreensis]|uniref:Cys-Gln thioester bond-forming surface protein n=1 Tax=Dokdonella koreensis TaxID=323415 RepID=UPI0016807CD5|nr:Cys-Gln thioester bond-forming surface protein [Dokdonella koreensis]